MTATRINVEPMGTPAGSLEDLFAQFEEGTAPAGTAPLETAPAGTAPAGTEPVGTAPAGTEPAGTDQRAPNRPGPRRPILRCSHDGLVVAPGSSAGEPLDGTRLAPQCWTRREPQYPRARGVAMPYPALAEGKPAVVDPSTTSSTRWR